MLPRLVEFSLTQRVFTLLVAFATGLVFGLLPGLGRGNVAAALQGTLG